MQLNMTYTNFEVNNLCYNRFFFEFVLVAD